MSNTALDKINEIIDANFFDEDSNVIIVLGMPTSDIGKGTIVTHLLSFLDNSDAIKFDGLLNTNANGRHTAQGWDDFGIYEKYNKDKKFGTERYLLGGYLYKDFIDKYGEDENLCFRPHFWKYFVATIAEMYRSIHSPKNLIIEIGGTVIDYEVDAYVPPAIHYIKQKLGHRCKIILLTMTDRNGKYIKTRIVQRAVETLAQRFITPDIILCREPSYIPKTSLEDKYYNEKIIQEKLNERLGISIDIGNIVTIPYYPPKEIDKMGTYLKERLKNRLKRKKIFLGTKNISKINDYKNFISGFEIITPFEVGLEISIEENTYSLLENSQKKALEWAKVSGLPTISEDTGFFVQALDGKPGVSVKTRGGELKHPLSEKEFLDFIKNKFLQLEDTSCYFYTVVSLGFPDGKVVSITDKTEGYIDINKFDTIHEVGYPLGAIFIAYGRGKTWTELTNEEKKISMKGLITKVNTLLYQYYEKL